MFRLWKYTHWRISAQVQANADACVRITRRSLGWYSRSLLGPDRFCPGGRTSRSPRRLLRLRPWPYIPGWLWPDSDMMLRTWMTDWLQLLTDVNTMLAQHTMQWSKAREPQGRDDLTNMFLFPRHTRLKSRLCVSLQTRLLSFHVILRKLGYRWTRNAFSMKLAYPLCLCAEFKN